MGLDDLLGDRQAQAGILPEALFRPVGVETLENLIERIRTNSGPVVIDQDFNLVFQPAAGNAHAAAWRRKRTRIVDQVAHDLSEPGVVTRRP